MNELPRPSMMLREQEETPSNNADPDERKIKWKDDVETMKEKIELLRKEHESAKEETEELLRRHKNELDDEDERMEGAFQQLSVLRTALNDSARRRRRRRQSTPNGKGQHHEREIRSTTSPRSMTVPVNKTTAVKGYNELEIERKDVSNNDDAFDKRDVMMQLRTPALCNTRNLSRRVDDSTPILEDHHERRMHSKTTTTTTSSSTQQHSTTPAKYYTTTTTTVAERKNEPKIERKKPHDPFDRLNVLQDYLSRGTKSHPVDERRKATTPITSNKTNARGEENAAFFDPFHNDDDNNGRRSEETTTTTATTSAPADCDPFEGLNSMTMMQQQSAFGDGETRTNDDVPLRRERRLLQSTNSTTVADGTTEAEGYASSDRWRL